MSLFRKAPKPVVTQTNPYLERVKNVDLSRFHRHAQGVEEVEITAPYGWPIPTTAVDPSETREELIARMLPELVLERPEDHPIYKMIEEVLAERPLDVMTAEEENMYVYDLTEEAD